MTRRLKSKSTSRVDMMLARIEVEEVVVDADDRGVVDFKFSPGRESRAKARASECQ